MKENTKRLKESKEKEETKIKTRKKNENRF
jgi:hypothetical protein